MKDSRTFPAEEKQSPWLLRNLIAVLITVFVVGGTVFIASYILLHPSNDGSVNLGFIGQTLLPLWATWIGTVLAFYFGKANFEAATRSYQEVIRKLTPEEKIAGLQVKDSMLPVNKIEYLHLESERSKPVKEILERSEFKNYNRFAVFDENKVVKYMIHRPTFYEFIYLKSAEAKKQGTTIDTDKLVLDDLLTYNDEKIKNTLTRGFGFVPLDATLLDAKRVIDSINECQDVFVTQSGTSTEPVLGLITNSRIFEKARV